MSKEVLDDEAAFRVSGNVSMHKCRIWAVQNPRASVKLQSDSPKVNVFYASTE
jgi:hypothetical protein